MRRDRREKRERRLDPEEIILTLGIFIIIFFTAYKSLTGWGREDEEFKRELEENRIEEVEEIEEEPEVIEIFEETVALEYEIEPMELSDREIIARVIYQEARGEKFIGKIAVGATILNRSAMWGRDILDIVMEPHQYAYSDEEVTASCYEAADFVLQNREMFPANMIYFAAGGYHEGLGKKYMQIGNHYFSTKGEPEWENEILGFED